MENNKTCKNCKNFRQHYVKRNTIFLAIEGGHCVHRKLNTVRKKTRFAPRENCEFWESGEELKPKRREDIKNVLREMNEHLRQIEIILKDDE